ncbi:MAG: hypothetical protein MUO23_06105, partial [Anaerolineales bacterium]|nr:hypothetical protein [Anaerolineales bacterium]
MADLSALPPVLDHRPPPVWRQAALLALGLVLALRLALGMLMGLAWTIGRGSLDPQWLAGMYGHLRVPESPTGQFLLG